MAEVRSTTRGAMMTRTMLAVLRCAAVLAIVHILTVSTGAAQDLVASYPFDGNANDASGNGNNGVVFGATPTVDRYGVPNKAYSFNGTGDFIEIPHNDALNFDGVDFSISAWIRLADPAGTSFMGIVSKGPVGTSYPGWQLCVVDGIFLSEEVTIDNGMGADRMNASVAIPELSCNRWCHVALVVQPSINVISLYVDGALAATKSLSDVSITTATDNIAPMAIGADRNRSAFFAGAIDDVRLYNGALTPAQIRSLHSDAGLWPPATSTLNLGGDTLVDFGSLNACQSVSERRVLITNPGSEAVVLDTVSVPAGLAIISPSLPVSIVAGGVATLQVQWAPGAVGRFDDSLAFGAAPCFQSQYRIGVVGSKAGAAVMTPSEIDFGQVSGCDSAKTLNVPISFFNTDGGQGMLSGIVCTPPFSTTVMPGREFVSGVDDSIPVVFSPATDDIFTGSMRLTIQPCGIQKEVQLRGTRITPQLTILSAPTFSNVPFGERASRVFSFLNNGRVPVHVTSINEPGNGFDVDTTLPPLPATLNEGDSLRVFVTFRPNATESRARLTIVSPDLCGADVAADLLGFGDISAAKVAVLAPKIAARVGERFVLPLESLSDVDLDTLGLYDFTAELAFDKTVMLPVDPTGLADSGRLSTLTINGRRPVGSTTLAEIPCVAALGDSDGTPIRVVGFTWRNVDALPVTMDDGSLTIEGICRQGGVRLFNGSVRTAIKSIAPNPAGDHLKVEFDVGETGPVHLGLSDRLGSEARVLVEGDLASGTYEAECDLTGLATGIYWCVLRTPGTHAQASVTIKQ